MEEFIKISISEFISQFGDWAKDIERKNIILWDIRDDSIIICFKIDFQFICAATVDELKEFYKNERMTDSNVIEAFVQQYLVNSTARIRSIVKYAI